MCSYNTYYSFFLEITGSDHEENKIITIAVKLSFSFGLGRRSSSSTDLHCALLSNNKMLAELLFLGISLVAASEGKHWALVVAGSSGWYNYRHQVPCSAALSNPSCW